MQPAHQWCDRSSPRWGQRRHRQCPQLPHQRQVEAGPEDDGVKLVCEGLAIESKLRGKFNIYNMLAAIAYTRALGITIESIKAGLEKVTEIKGRGQIIPNGLGIEVIVDYAHTPDSLCALYETYNNKKKICVLGNCGGGRDKWKRKAMAEIADKFCDQIKIKDQHAID